MSAPQKYIDARGVTWDTAEEALQDFVNELPPLTDEETELVFSATNHEWPASRNLAAIEYAIHYHGLSQTFGYFPIPHPWDEHPTVHYSHDPTFVEAQVLAGALAIGDPGWEWEKSSLRNTAGQLISRLPTYMKARDFEWDMEHVPFFQQQRTAFNRRVLAGLHKIAGLEVNSKDPRRMRVVVNPIDPKEARFLD